MRTVVLTAPSSWAPYLINNDDSGLDAEEVRQIQLWLMENKLDFPVSCVDAGFMNSHDASVYVGATDCQNYTFFEFQGEQPPYILESSLEDLLDDFLPF